jgi:capsular polysaccharide biosynthesis protein
LLLEDKPFGSALMNAIFWPAGVYNVYIAGG